MKNLMPISTKVLELLKNEGIEEYEYISVINNIKNNIESALEEVVELEDVYFNLTRDIVWYNFERDGMHDTLVDYGAKFPKFMHICDNDDFIIQEDFEGLYNELKKINELLNTKENIFFVTLNGKDELFNKETKIHFIDKRKDKQEKRKKKNKNELICYIKEDLSCYKMEEIKVFMIVEKLLSAIEKAREKKSKIRVEFT